MHRRGWGLLGLCAGLLALFAAVAHADPYNVRGRPGQLTVGDTAPPLALERVAGSDEVTLTGLNGRVVVLDFWATWCGPCRAVMPALDDLHRRHHAQGLSVVGMSPESHAQIQRHIGANPVEYTIARDAGGTTQGAYGVRAIPTLVVVDRRGEVRAVMVGADGQAIQRLDRLVTQLLAERPR